MVTLNIFVCIQYQGSKMYYKCNIKEVDARLLSFTDWLYATDQFLDSTIKRQLQPNIQGSLTWSLE